MANKPDLIRFDSDQEKGKDGMKEQRLCDVHSLKDRSQAGERREKSRKEEGENGVMNKEENGTREKKGGKNRTKD